MKKTKCKLEIVASEVVRSEHDFFFRVRLNVLSGLQLDHITYDYSLQNKPKRFNQLCKALGLHRIEDTEELHFKPFYANVMFLDDGGNQVKIKNHFSVEEENT